MRNDRVDAALLRTLSPERLEKYLAAQSGHLDGALSLYERNMLLAAAFHVPLQIVEICLRNVVNDRMSATYGPDWLIAPTAAPLSGFSRAQIGDARAKIRGDVSAGAIVAEATFAFWVGLLATQYDATLWRRALHRGFRVGGGRKRSDVHGRFNAIRRFRNRVAHHEPIFDRPVERMHAEILEAIGWMCGDTRAWAEHHSRVRDALGSG